MDKCSDRIHRKLEKHFSNNKEGPNLSTCCPVCNNKGLHRHYQIGKKMKPAIESDQDIAKGAEWQWCAVCLHYKFSNLAYVPLDWDCELNIEPWKLMTIPEPINEKLMAM